MAGLALRQPEVLNAFRHHGIGHKATAKDFREINRCSTPSGIMESVTVVLTDRLIVLWVLNAFRHHGIGHLADPVAPGAYLLVLNAFRHHGIGHC